METPPPFNENPYPRDSEPFRKPTPWLAYLLWILLLGMVVAVLFPVFDPGEGAAISTSCLSNIKQLGTAAKLYAADFDEALLPETTAGFLGTKYYADDPVNHGTGAWPNPGPSSRLAQIWTTTIQPYTKYSGFLLCESFSQQQFHDAVDKPDCDGNGTAEYFKPTVFKGRYNLDVGHGGKLSDYGIASASTSGAYGGSPGKYGCIFGVEDTVGTTICPYYNMAGNGWFYENGCSSVDCATYQNLRDAYVIESARSVVFRDGMTSVFSSAGNADTAIGYPRVVNYFGCGGTGRHEGVGANYGFLDSHSKYIAVTLETILTADPNSPGNYYVKYLSYDK